MASKKYGVLYTGVTNNLLRRVYEHKNKINKGFTSKYNIDKLVYYQQTGDIRIAIQREKQIKWWKRKWKLELIDEFNAEWKDLYYDIGGTNDMFDDLY